MKPHIARITVYPIKSLDGVDVDASQVLAAGALEHDRRFALQDLEGRIVNGKRCAEIHRVRAHYDLAVQLVTLSMPAAQPQTFSLEEQTTSIGEWLSEAIGMQCELKENAAGGFPDDLDAPGPTLISTATLEQTATWFDGLTADDVRRRLRANIELGGLSPMGEDRLAGDQRAFRLGQLTMEGATVCRRCVVPSRDPISGQPTVGFQKTFATQREKLLPEGSPREQFDHFYRVAINTKLPANSPGGMLALGDELVVGV